MRLKGLVIALLALLVAYVVGGNFYLRRQVERSFYSRLARWEEKVKEGLPPGQEIEVDVKEIKPSFTLLPFFSPFQSFVIHGVRCTFPEGELSLERIAGTARTSLGKVEDIQLAAVEGLEARSGNGTLGFAMKGLVFTPMLDLNSFLGPVKGGKKVVGGRAEGISLNFVDKRGGKVDLAVGEVSFREDLDMRREGGVLSEEPLKASFLFKKMTVGYQSVGKDRGAGEALFRYMKVDTSLKRNDDSYDFKEGMNTELSRLKLLPGSKDKRKMNPEKILPLKGDFRIELAGMSQGLVDSLFGLLQSYQSQNLDQQQKLALMLQFLQRALPPFMASTFKGYARLNFPQDSSISFHFQERIVNMISARRSGNPLWMTVKVRGKDRLFSLLTQAGFKDEAMEKFFSGFVCDGEVCVKRVPLGKGRHKF